MKIHRTINGIQYEFELTDVERYQCYCEQQHRYDKMEVAEELISQGLEGMATEEEIENMAEEMRYDMGG